ncbi:hypothetical protein AAFF_G00352690 [Aldrovandia affinis]|uniref:Uncharacterized protein n=1 Tax=Aldrovandia affinis TaxID=143900 RepID=A0AAD7WNJ3_9TELE|nr:hypothetical protein AAFF_G00352690 [Aldrovandia affinis]
MPSAFLSGRDAPLNAGVLARSSPRRPVQVPQQRVSRDGTLRKDARKGDGARSVGFEGAVKEPPHSVRAPGAFPSSPGS